MPRKHFTVDDAISKIAANSDSEDDISSEDDGWPSSDIENRDVDGHVDSVHAAPDHLSAVQGLGWGVRGRTLSEEEGAG